MNIRTPQLVVDRLSFEYGQGVRSKRVLHQVSLRLEAGRILGVAGESGSGKTTLALAVIGAARADGHVVDGTVRVGEHDVWQVRGRKKRRLWGRDVGYVPQGAVASLSPSLRLDRQLRDVERAAGIKGTQQTRVDLLASVGLADVPGLLRRFPHELSGGQQQRFCIALALIGNPRLLVLDEPTSSLDAVTQRQIGELVREIVNQRRLAALFVSHDLGLLTSIADDLVIMYSGEIVETVSRERLANRRHPYTHALVAANPDVNADNLPPGLLGTPPGIAIVEACAFGDRCTRVRPECLHRHPPMVTVEPGHQVACFDWESQPVANVPTSTVARDARDFSPTVLEVKNLTVTFAQSAGPALDDVSISLGSGEVLGVVGESGSGKSTLLNVICGLQPPDQGTVEYLGTPLPSLRDGRSRQTCGQVQIVFQSADTALNPRFTVRETLRRSVTLYRPDLRRTQASEAAMRSVLDDVHLPAFALDRMPGDLSGGERQRVALARAFLARPRVLLCDEITSALDVSVQAAVLHILDQYRLTHGTSVVFVTHGMALVRAMCDRLVVLKDGRVVEAGESERVLDAPRSSYLRELLGAIPARVE